MAQETVYLGSSVSGTATSPNNALGNSPSTWAGVVNVNTSWTHVWAFTNPSLPNLATGTQSVTLVARKGSNTNNPTVQFTVTRGGVTLATSASTTVTSTTGQNVTATWTRASADDSSQGVQISVVATSVGGSGSARNSAQVSMATWVAQVEAPTATNYNGSATRTGTGTFSATGVIGLVASAALAATGVLTATGQAAASVYGGTSLTGTGTLAATGQVTVHRSGQSTLEGTNTLTATGQSGKRTGASRAGSGTITASGSASAASLNIPGIESIKAGSTPVTKVFVGSTQIWGA